MPINYDTLSAGAVRVELFFWNLSPLASPVGSAWPPHGGTALLYLHEVLFYNPLTALPYTAKRRCALQTAIQLS